MKLCPLSFQVLMLETHSGMDCWVRPSQSWALGGLSTLQNFVSFPLPPPPLSEDSMCKPRREPSLPTNPPDTLILDFGLLICENHT